MHISRSLVLCAAVAFVSVGCEVHDAERDRVVVHDQASVDVPQGAVVDGPGVVAIDVEPDPSQRVYVYDEGYPPGTYIYNDYYYYGGYRYPRDVFVNRFVQDNIRQHRYTNADDNRRQGQQIEQRQRTEFTKTRGVRQNVAGRPAAAPADQSPVRQPEAPRANIDHPENRPAANDDHRANVQQPENRIPAKEEAHPNVERPANATPGNEQRPANVERPGNAAPAKEERPANGERPENKAKPENEQRKPNTEEPKKEEAK
jgi:hypothetical protein